MITISKIQQWVEEGKDSNKIAFALINNAISRHVPLHLSDLPDTATLASEIDAISECIDNKEYQAAIDISIESAEIILEEEGFEVE